MNAAYRVIVSFALVGATLGPAAAAEDAPSARGIIDTVLEKLDVKAAPSDPAPDFVRKTRPDASSLEYMQRALPHKVSPEAVKTPDEIQAAKDALDAARERQLGGPRSPTALVKAKAKPRAKPAK